MGLLEVGGALLGGLLGKSKPKYVIPPYAKIRQQAEAAGFNPLTALGLAPGSVVSSDNSSIGSGIANAALLAADAINGKKQDATEVLQSENAQLRSRVERLTLRPNVGGLYAAPVTVPSRTVVPNTTGTARAFAINDQTVLEVPADVLGPRSGSRYGRDLGYVPLVGGLDQRRETRIDPTPNDGGHTIIQPPGVLPFAIPTVDGEPVSPQMFTMSLGYLASRIHQFSSEGMNGTGRTLEQFPAWDIGPNEPRSAMVARRIRGIRRNPLAGFAAERRRFGWQP